MVRLMEGIFFWIIVAAVVGFFALTTPRQREEMIKHLLTLVVVLAVIGFLTEVLWRGKLPI